MTITLLAKDQVKTLRVQPNISILDAPRTGEDMPIHAPCGGQGICVWIVDTAGDTPVLACRTPAQDGMMFPEED